MRLDVALVGHRRPVLALDDEVGGGEARLHVALLVVDVQRDVRGRVARGAVRLGRAARLVEDGRAVEHGVADVHDVRQDLVLDVDQGQRVLRGVLVDGRHGGDGVPDVEHAVAREHVVRAPDFAGVLRAVALRGREVGVGDDGAHAGMGFGAAAVDAEDAGVGVGAAQDRAGQHAGQAHVGAVLGPADDLVDAVMADGACANDLVSGLFGGDHGVPSVRFLRESVARRCWAGFGESR